MHFATLPSHIGTSGGGGGGGDGGDGVSPAGPQLASCVCGTSGSPAGQGRGPIAARHPACSWRRKFVSVVFMDASPATFASSPTPGRRH